MVVAIELAQEFRSDPLARHDDPLALLNAKGDRVDPLSRRLSQILRALGVEEEVRMRKPRNELLERRRLESSREGPITGELTQARGRLHLIPAETTDALSVPDLDFRPVAEHRFDAFLDESAIKRVLQQRLGLVEGRLRVLCEHEPDKEGLVEFHFRIERLVARAAAHPSDHRAEVAELRETALGNRVGEIDRNRASGSRRGPLLLEGARILQDWEFEVGDHRPRRPLSQAELERTATELRREEGDSRQQQRQEHDRPRQEGAAENRGARPHQERGPADAGLHYFSPSRGCLVL